MVTEGRWRGWAGCRQRGVEGKEPLPLQIHSVSVHLLCPWKLRAGCLASTTRSPSRKLGDWRSDTGGFFPPCPSCHLWASLYRRLQLLPGGPLQPTPPGSSSCHWSFLFRPQGHMGSPLLPALGYCTIPVGSPKFNCSCSKLSKCSI